MTACEPLILLFESNRKRFATLVTSNKKQKQKSCTYMQRETLLSSNKRCNNLNNQLRAYKLFKLKDIQSYNDTNGTKWLLTTSTNMDFNQILYLDPTFAEESRLTFTVMYQLMSKYLDSISFQGEVD
ncbi:1992_t:CDS:2, partial [Cetraspora pellucida]